MPEWTWDPDKDAKNLQRHGLTLSDGAMLLESDRYLVSRPDPHTDGDRWQTIAKAGGITVLFIVHTDPVKRWDGTEIGRVISVRRATPRERRAYEEGEF